MKIIKLNPRTPGTRHQLNLTKNALSKTNKICKNIVYNIPRHFGRSSQTGHITVWHRGGGCKKLYKKVDFNSEESTNLILSIHYDSFRSSFIALAFDIFKKKFSYLLNTQATFPGTLITCTRSKPELFFGNRTLVANFPIGSLIYNLSSTMEGSAKFSRSAGTFCQILQKKNDTAQIRLPSGNIIMQKINTYASLGVVSNLKHNLVVAGKAGRTRLRGFRPIVRGVAMNPVDHPHGGRTNGGRPSVSPWGILTKGKPTVR